MGYSYKDNRPRPNKKKRRHSGRYTPGLTVNPKDMIAEDIPYVLSYDDWENYRDSYRDSRGDRSRILKKPRDWSAEWEEEELRILRDNRKHKTHAKRREAKKSMIERQSSDVLP